MHTNSFITLRTVILSALILLLNSSLFAQSIYQHFDGDGDGSLFLADLAPIPGVNLSDEILYWADLPGADLSYSNLVNTNFYSSILSNSNLSYSQMNGINLEQSNIESSSFSFSYVINANVSNSNASSVDFSFTTLEFSNFQNTDLSDSIFFNTNLSSANFENANLMGADMSGARYCEEANFNGAFYDSFTRLGRNMDPDSLGMILVPSPSATFVLLPIFYTLRMRRI